VDVVGSLVIVGGGKLPPAIRDAFLELAGGKKARLVVIPTASNKADHPELLTTPAFWKAQGVASVVTLHTHSRERANDPAFVKPLTEATGVWLTGGDQSRLVEAYHGTAVERELRNVLRRGGVIGGTSAGASIMSGLMILGGNPVARTGQGFDLLPGVVVDQHFVQRHRLDRLLGVLAKYPTYFGVGIDEQTGIIVHGHNLTVVGNATVRVCTPGADRGPAGVKVLKPGDRFDLLALTRPAASRLQASRPKEKPDAASSRRALSP
jgi:cyanophycinase